MSASEKPTPSGEVSSPEPIEVELKTQLEAIKSQLTSTETKVGKLLETVETNLSSAESALDKSTTQLEAIKSQLTSTETKVGKLLETVETNLSSAESALNKTREDLRWLKAQKLDSRWLAGVVAVLGVIVGAGFVYLSIYIFKNDPSWQQSCGVLGLCLIWVVFATISIRILADRTR